MNTNFYFAQISLDKNTVYFGGFLFLVILALIMYFIFDLWKNRKLTCPCPYTGTPLRPGSHLSMLTREAVYRYLYDLHSYDNRIFDLHKSGVSRDTGRIFPSVITWYGAMELDWSFLQKRYPGNFVSWGSLTREQQLLIREQHKTLEGFQTDYSSPNPAPRNIEYEYAQLKPGPLYVDINTGILLGWKEVPETDVEVLIVQKPMKKYRPGAYDSSF